MPRLSPKQYLSTRRSLSDGHGWMYELDPDEVVAVARFFAPTKSFTDTEALTHRRKVTAADPSLPNRVGKILKKPHADPPPLEREVARAVGVPEPGPTLVGPKGREKVLLVSPIRRDSPDLRKLAAIFEMELRRPEGEGLFSLLEQRDQDDVV